VLLACGLLALQGVQVQALECTGTELLIFPENVAEVEACARLEYENVAVMGNITSVDLSNLFAVENFAILGDALQSISIPNLERVNNAINFFNIAAGVSINFASLRNASSVAINNVAFPSLSFPVMDVIQNSMESLNCSGVIDDDVFPVLQSAGELLFADIEEPLTVSGFNQALTVGAITVESVKHLTLSGFNGNLTANIYLSDVRDSVVSGFNGLVEGYQIRVQDAHNTVISGFNGGVVVGYDGIILMNLHDVVVSGFNGSVSSEYRFRLAFCYDVVVNGFNGVFFVDSYFDFYDIYNSTFSGFNGDVSMRELYVWAFQNWVVSGFNGNVKINDYVIMEAGAWGEFSGFNGVVDVKYDFSMSDMVSLRVSGFNGRFKADFIDIDQLYGPSEVSGFNGYVNLTDSLRMKNFYDYEDCNYCYYMYLSEDYVAGIDNNTRLVVSGFNGELFTENIEFEGATISVELSGFQGHVSFVRELSFMNMGNLTIADGAFGDLSVRAPAEEEDDYGPYYLLSAELPSTTYEASIYFEECSFHKPTLASSFNLQPNTNASIAFVFDVILWQMYGLHSIHNSFNGIEFGTQVVLDTVPDLEAVTQSYTHMHTITTVMYIGATGLPKIDKTSFASLKSTAGVMALDNPSLQSLDFLLNTPNVTMSVQIGSNPALRSLSGLCGIVPQPQANFLIVNNTALCCADLEQIFDAELYNGTDINIEGCDNSTTCAGGYVCECASFEADVCPNDGFCLGVRSGLQCLNCESNEIFNSSLSQCQDCPAATFANRTTCEACSVFGAACTACDADQCTTCAAPATNVNGVCRVCDLACQNNGKCTLSQSGQFCACPTGFGGALCQTAQTFDVVTETKQSANVTNKRTNFAVNKPFVVDTKVAKPAGVTIVDVDLYQVRVSPLDVVLYEPVIGQAKAGQLTPTGTQASLTFSYTAATRNLQVSFMPLASFLGSQSSAKITVEVEFLLSYTVDSAASSSVSKKVAVLRTIVPVLQSGEVFTTTITVEQAVTLYPTEEAADEAQQKEDNPVAPSSGSDDLSEGAIAGIVIGSVVGAVALIGLGMFCMRRSSGAKSASGTEMSVRN